MIKILTLFIFFAPAACVLFAEEAPFPSDNVPTSEGNLKMTFIGHGTLMFTFGGKVIHVDPWERLADYSTLLKADIVLITHEHRDHFDMSAVEAVKTDTTVIVYTKSCADQLENPRGQFVVMHNGDRRRIGDIDIAAVPAYNIEHTRDNGDPFHPKGVGNGYVVTFGDTKVYVAGDTENIQEMADLEDIDIAFLPMNLPYTMTPEMVAAAAGMVKPDILYPYHYGDTDTGRIVELLKDSETKVRIRPLQ